MPLPQDWGANDQHRMATLDRELVQSLVSFRRALLAAVAVKQRFEALQLAERWPDGSSDFVHQDKDAQTKQEQLDAFALIDFCRDHLLGDGTESNLPDGDAAAIFRRFAQG